MINKKSFLSCLILIYLFLPFTLFLIGWTKLIISVPVFIILYFCFFRMLKSFPDLWIPNITKDNITKIAAIICIIIGWVYLSGIGSFVAQRSDHNVRNAVFRILVEEKWPVVYSYSFVGGKFSQGPIAFVYHFGYWLPSAVVGKIFGMLAGNIAQMLWASMGIFLFYYFILAKFVKKIVVWPLVVIIFFSGLDVIGLYLTGTEFTDWAPTVPALGLSTWARPFTFGCMTSQLFWGFNFNLPVWFATMLLWEQKNNRFIALILALTMINSPLGFIGMIMLAICIIIKNSAAEIRLTQLPGRMKALFMNIFTFENIAGGGTVGIISFLFLKLNIRSQQGINLVGHNSLKGTLFLFLLFYIIAVGLYLIAVFKYQKNSYVFYYSAVWLAVCPWVHFGLFYDFSFRASIPALIVLLCLVIDTINKCLIAKDIRSLVIIIALLVIGSYTPIWEIRNTTIDTVRLEREHGQISRVEVSPVETGARHYLGYINNNIFFDYIARIPKKQGK